MGSYKSKYDEWAEADGVQKYRGFFYPKCSVCEDEYVRIRFYRPHQIYVCDKCKTIIKKLRFEKHNEPDVREKIEKRFDTAVEKLRKQGCNRSWDKAIEVARTRIEKYGSVPEAMMAIALIHYRYKIIPQQKVGQYIVDFAIPKEQIVVEVDGKPYHKDYSKEADRDEKIMLMLGVGWDVMHVPAEAVEKDINHAVDFYVKRQKRTVIG